MNVDQNGAQGATAMFSRFRVTFWGFPSKTTATLLKTWFWMRVWNSYYSIPEISNTQSHSLPTAAAAAVAAAAVATALVALLSDIQ